MIEYDRVRPAARLGERVGAVLGTLRRNGRVQTASGVFLAEAATAAYLTAVNISFQAYDTEDAILRGVVGTTLGAVTMLITADTPNFLQMLANRAARIQAQERKERTFQAGDRRGLLDYLSDAWQTGRVQRFTTMTRQTPLTAEQVETQRRWQEALRPRTPAELQQQELAEFYAAERNFAAWQNRLSQGSQEPNPFIWEKTIQLPPEDK